MINKVKIKISEQAYYNLLDIIKAEEEKLCIRFAYKDGCCGSTKIDIILDKASSEDTLEYIDELPVIYNSEVAENINEITLVYRNNSFMANTVMSKTRDCATCTVGCKSSKDKSSGCSGSCSKCK